MELDKQIDYINSVSESCQEILNALVVECSRDLDAYIDVISSSYNDSTLIDNFTLDNFILNLPLLIYYTSAKLEALGLKNDLSSVERKKQLTEFMIKNPTALKNKSDRQVAAEINSIDIVVLNDIYDRAYKIVKTKIDTAYELLASCKKIMSRRIEEIKLSNSDTGRQSFSQEGY